jgi:hypothetical protein
MYMNCAAVTVTNGGSGLSGPTPFVANANVNEQLLPEKPAGVVGRELVYEPP